MASISSLTGSSSSSIYGTRNVISGLASGLDTETLIENSVSGYKSKITSIQQEITTWEWKQESYRSMISKMSGFLSSYTTFSSANSLKSRSFFTNAVIASTHGTHASKVSASGKSSSDISLLGVKQLATAATYRVSASSLSGANVATNSDNTVTATASRSFDLNGEVTIGNVSGTVSLKYGNETISLTFDSSEKYANGQELADAIQKKLEAITAPNNDNQTCADLIKVEYSGSGITFSAQSGSTKVSVDSSTCSALKTSKNESESASLTINGALTTTKNAAECLKDKSINVTLDGVTKSIKLPTASSEDDFISQLNTEIADAFGKGKLTVGKDGEGKLQFTTGQAGSTFKVVSSDAGVNEALGLGKLGATGYVDTNSTLSDLLGDDLAKYATTDENGKTVYELTINDTTLTFSADTSLSAVINKINSSDAGVTMNYSQITNQFTLIADETGTGGKVEMGDDLAKALFGGNGEYAASYTKGQDAVFTMSVNGVEMETSRSTNTFDVDGMSITLNGTFNYEDTRVKDEETGYYKAAEKFSGWVKTYNADDNTWGLVFKESELLNENGEYVDENGNVLYDASSGLSMTGDAAKTGSFADANGNAVGDSVLVKNPEAVTFSTKPDASKITDVVSKMVTDLNALLTEVKDAFSTMPLTNSSGEKYMPLTEDDKADMSESAISSYEEKAKTGMLFGDRDLSNFYYSMITALSSRVNELEAIGISQAYADGKTTLVLDEEKLAAALEKDADAVADIFAGGDSGKGLMSALQTPLERYGKTSGTKGILVEKAGSTLAASTLYNNEIYNKLEELNEEVEKWQDVISDKIDYYTTKFTYLEQLVAQMNNQSSMLMGLSGGY